jgi:hypothetical protein
LRLRHFPDGGIFAINGCHDVIEANKIAHSSVHRRDDAISKIDIFSFAETGTFFNGNQAQPKIAATQCSYGLILLL